LGFSHGLTLAHSTEYAARAKVFVDFAITITVTVVALVRSFNGVPCLTEAHGIAIATGRDAVALANALSADNILRTEPLVYSTITVIIDTVTREVQTPWDSGLAVVHNTPIDALSFTH